MKIIVEGESAEQIDKHLDYVCYVGQVDFELPDAGSKWTFESHDTNEYPNYLMEEENARMEYVWAPGEQLNMGWPLRWACGCPGVTHVKGAERCEVCGVGPKA